MRIFGMLQGRGRRLRMALLAAVLGLVVGPAWTTAEEGESEVCEQEIGRAHV